MNATDIGTATERVARGAALLDERMPNWRPLINLDQINQPGHSILILHQLIPHAPRFDHLGGKTELETWIGTQDRATEIMHGFEPLAIYRGPFLDDAYHAESGQLIEAWRSELSKGQP